MKNVIKGNLSGFLCGECKENISQAMVRLYMPERGANVEASLAASSKETFKLLSTDEVKAKQNRLLGEAMTDDAGNFEVVLKGDYGNSVLEFDFECGTVPRFPIPHKKFPPRQFHVTTFYPQFDSEEFSQKSDIRTATFNHIVPARWWCEIKGKYFDIWTICGILTDCATGSPLPGIKVIAMDADFITDDELGYDLTDGNGRFTIYYNSAKFKKTFLSPILNIETDISGPFASGPDVYFQLEYNGQRFALETAANRRNNVGYCLCVKLCAKELKPVEPTIPPSFTHFGLTQYIPIQSGINASNGKTNSGYAFFSSVNLVGTISKKINNAVMEYMFEYLEVSSPSAAINPSAVWSPVTPNMIDKTEIGYLWTLSGNLMNPINQEPYYINGTGTEKTVVFSGNWIRVPQDSNFVPHSDGGILKLNTEKLTGGITTIDMAMPTSGIGSATVSGTRPHVGNRYFAIRMRQREIGNAGTEATAGTSKPIAIYNVRYNNVNKYGSWAPATVSGQPIALSLDLQEIIAGAGGCSKITTALHIKYGARNENLSNVNLSIVGPHKPGQSFGFNPVALMAAPETFGTTQLVFTPATDTVNDLLACAYTVRVTATALMTTGDDYMGSVEDLVSFCKV